MKKLTNKSVYGVFILEALREDDFTDGYVLHEILRLSKIPTRYLWVNSVEEFADAIKEFQKSNLRYLHLSCHADKGGIEIGGTEVNHKQLSELLKQKITRKRIFLSACQGSNRMIATSIIAKCRGQSLIGTPIDLRFDKAALFWPSFYHVINSVDSTKMNQKSLRLVLKRCVDLFEIPINYYHTIDNRPNSLMRLKIRPHLRTSVRMVSII